MTTGAECWKEALPSASVSIIAGPMTRLDFFLTTLQTMSWTSGQNCLSTSCNLPLITPKHSLSLFSLVTKKRPTALSSVSRSIYIQLLHHAGRVPPRGFHLGQPQTVDPFKRVCHKKSCDGRIRTTDLDVMSVAS